MKITGYSDRLSVAAGDDLIFRISSESTSYRARLVRLIHGDRNPDGPGFKSEPVPSSIDGEYPGRVQRINYGSCALIPSLGEVEALSLACWFWPTTPALAGQVILSYADGAVSVELDDLGRPLVAQNGEPALSGKIPLQQRTWYHLCLRIDKRGQCALDITPRDDWPELVGDAMDGPLKVALPAAGNLAFAAKVTQGAHTGHYNGKIENPRAFGRYLQDQEVERLRAGEDGLAFPGCIASWDFGQEQHGDRIVDRSASAHHGKLLNMPTRAMTGHNWSGTNPDFKDAPEEYGAIHFHDDDLDDAGWADDFTLSVPRDLPSGIYAVHLTCDLGEDHIPFFVTPSLPGASSRIAYVIPTLTYLAYGNEALANRPDIRQLMLQAGIDAAAFYPVQDEDKYIVSNRLLSCYDIHHDGSGVSYSSYLRPLLNIRPSYRMPLHGLSVKPGGAPHLLNADLCIADWMEAQGFPFDVITDHEVDTSGVELLSKFDVIVTGSHPEYCTAKMFDAFEHFCRAGGKIMYLGGNGFCGVTSITERRHAIELRRGHTNRPWSSLPGEEYHSTTGELGGGWKSRNRPAQRLVGVGTTSVGFTGGGSYRKTEAGRDGRFGWVFQGVEGDEIGAGPNLIYGDGAAGWEIDRADEAAGTPRHAIVLATARIEDESYHQILDELEAPGPHSAGPVNPNVRADMVYLEYPGGGAAFSVGSCLWAGSLSRDGYDNDVSAVTGNVMRKFLADA